MFYSSFLKSFWKTDSRRSNSSLFLFLFMNPVFRLHGDGAARWRTLPVLWMRDGVDDGIVDGRSLGNDGGDRVHVRSQHVCIPAAKKSGSVLKHIRTSPLTKSCFTFNQDHHHHHQCEINSLSETFSSSDWGPKNFNKSESGSCKPAHFSS